MAFEHIENIEDRTGETIVWRSTYQTDDPRTQAGTDTPLTTAFLMDGGHSPLRQRESGSRASQTCLMASKKSNSLK